MNVPNLLAAASLAAVAAGFWLLHPGLGLIVPGAVVFAALSYTHLKGPPRGEE